MAAATFEAKKVALGHMIDYTPGSPVVAGEVVVVGSLLGIALQPIAAAALGALALGGIFDVRREDTTAFTAGDKVYWDADGTCEGGGATGAAVDTSDSGANLFMGYAVADVANSATVFTVRVVRAHEMAAEAQALGDLSDVGDGAPSSGYLLIADADSWESEPVSGLVTLAADGEVGLPDQADSALGVPIIISKAFDGGTLETHIFDGNCPRKMRIIDAWVELTASGASATTLTLDDGTDPITDAMDIYNAGGILDKAIVRAGELDDAKSILAENATLDITLSDDTTSPNGIVRVLAIPVA